MLRIPSSPRALALSAVVRHAAFFTHMIDLQVEMEACRVEREALNKAAHLASSKASIALHHRHNGDPSAAEEAQAAATASLGAILPLRRGGEDGGAVAGAAAQLVAVLSFNSFLSTGTLGARPAGGYTDEEWLAGLISSAHEIGRYASVSAVYGDTESVRTSRAVVCALHDELLKFDLRNGQHTHSIPRLGMHAAASLRSPSPRHGSTPTPARIDCILFYRPPSTSPSTPPSVPPSVPPVAS